MPRIDISCKLCGAIGEVTRPVSEWPETPPCPTCGGATTQVHLPRGFSFTADPVVVYQAPDGTFRVPGDVSGPGSHKYEAMGYTRIEARSFAEVRRLEQRINESDLAHAGPLLERLQQRREEAEKGRRSELFHRMATMSPEMRDVAREIIRRNNEKKRRSSGSGSCYSEAYS